MGSAPLDPGSDQRAPSNDISGSLKGSQSEREKLFVDKGTSTSNFGRHKVFQNLRPAVRRVEHLNIDCGGLGVQALVLLDKEEGQGPKPSKIVFCWQVLPCSLSLNYSSPLTSMPDPPEMINQNL